MTPLHQLRADLGAAISTATGVITYPGTIANPYTPSVLLEGAGWSVDTSCLLAYDIAVTVLGSGRDITQSVDDVEDLAWRVYAVPAGLGHRVTEASAPTTVTVGGDPFLAVQFTVTILAQE